MKSSAYKAVLWVVILAMAGVFSLPELIKIASGNSKWIVRINDTIVEHDDFARAVAGQQEFVDMFHMQFGQNAEMLARLMGVTLDPQQLAYDKVIRDTLLNQVATNLGIVVHDDSITRQFQDPSFLQHEIPELVSRSVWGPNGIEISMLRAYLQRMGLTVADFESRVAQAIARRTVLSCLSGASYTSEAQIKERFVNEYLGKKFSVVSLPLTSFVAQENAKEISNAELAAFFNKKNTEEKHYWVPEKRAGMMWHFDPKKYGITVTEQEIQNYYDDNKVRQFVENPVRMQIRRMTFDTYDKAVQARQQFTANIDEFAKNAELLPLFAKGTHERELERAAFVLKNDGDVSEVVKTTKGFDLIQRVSKQAQTYKPLTKIKNDITNQLVEKKFTAILEKEEKEALQENRWQQFVQEKSGKQEAISLMANDNSPLAQTIFSLSNDGFRARVADHSGRVVQVTDIVKRNLPTLETVKDLVRTDLVAERADKARRDTLSLMRQQLKTEALTAVAKERGFTIKQTDWIQPQNQDAMKKLTDAGIPAAGLLQLEKIGTVLELPESGILARLDDIEPFNQETFNEQYAKLKRAQAVEGMQELQQGFIASLYRNATIKTNKL
jgi:hypothetical protein